MGQKNIMSDYNRNSRSGGGRSDSRFGGRGGGGAGRSFGGGGGRDYDRPAMHSAVCAKCGNECQVPFKPTGERPIYCSNCFESMRGGDDDRRGPRRDFDRPNFDDRRSRPQERDDRRTQPIQNNGQITELLNSLHLKVDKLLNALEPKAVKTPVSKKKTVEELVKAVDENSASVDVASSE